MRRRTKVVLGIVGAVILCALAVWLALFLRFRAPGLGVDQMLDLIDAYAEKGVLESVEFEDGATLVERGDLPTGDRMYATNLPDGGVRYEYFDSARQAFYTLAARADATAAEDRAAQKALVDPGAVQAVSLRWEGFLDSLKARLPWG